METAILHTLHYALHGTKLERRDLLVKVLACFPAEELGSVTTMVKRRRRKVLKHGNTTLLSIPLPEGCDVPLPVVPLPQVPSPTVSSPSSSTPAEFWFPKYGADRDPNKVVSFDVEMVGVPVRHFPLKTITWNDGKYVKFEAEDPSILCTHIKFKQVAAKVSVVNFNGETIYQARVKHERNTYLVNAYTIAKNGITHDELENGKYISIVRDKIEQLFSGSLVVTHAGVNDFGFLGIEPGEYIDDNFELQRYWHRKDGTGFKLKDVYNHYFGVTNFQVGVHSDEKDARATMRLFRFEYLKEKNLDTKYLHLKYDGTYCDSDFVRRTHEYDDD